MLWVEREGSGELGEGRDKARDGSEYERGESQ